MNNHWNWIENYLSKISLKTPWDQWVNISLKSVPEGATDKKVDFVIGSINGLALNKQQTITWINADQPLFGIARPQWVNEIWTKYAILRIVFTNTF